jgi:peptide/nickel transport system ATP-binding protein
MTALLDVRDLRVSFLVPEGRIEAVRGTSFTVPVGGTVALVGESGSGKSTVSQAIMSILPKPARIDAGEILFHDPATGTTTDIAKVDPESQQMQSIRGGRISVIFQEPMTSLSPLHTVGNQIGEALHLHRKVSKAEGREIVKEMLRLVDFPDPAKALDTYPFELSGGLRQRAMIAMALVCRPALLVADEPTTALDVTIQAQILKLIKDLQADLGMAVLLITHDLGVVANMAEQIVVLYQGEVMERGSARDIFGDPRHPYLRALLRAVPRFDMEPGERLVPIREIAHERGGALMAAKEPWPADADQAGPLLSVTGLTKQFTTRKGSFFGSTTSRAVLAVDYVEFSIQRGECLGLVGESGCGKTTVSKIIMRALSPDSGSITFNNRGTLVDLLALHGDALIRFRPRIQYIFQDPYSSLNPRMTLFDIVSEPLVIHGVGTAQSRVDAVRELMRLVGLDPRFLNRFPHSFSGGQRQRIGIARALALRPDLLICDEPVSALDVSIQAQILNLLKDLQQELSLTYLFISHNLAVVDYIADRIAVMCKGQLVELASRDEFFHAAVHPYTKALLSAVPHPDPGQRLDLTALMEGRASLPSAWPAPFTVGDHDGAIGMIHLGRGHYVRAHASADARELRTGTAA